MASDLYPGMILDVPEQEAYPGMEPLTLEGAAENSRNFDPEVVDLLPTHIRVAGIDALSIPVNKEVSAAAVGAGDMMSDVWHGAKQMLGIDEEAMAEEQQFMNNLYADDEVGAYALGGAVIGALAEPVGALATGGVSKLLGLGKVAKTAKSVMGVRAAEGAALGAGFGGVGYVDEEAGQTRIGNLGIGAALGTVLGGTLGFIGNKISKTRKLKAKAKAKRFVKEVEYDNAVRVLDGKSRKDAYKELAQLYPTLKMDLRTSKKLLEKKANLSMDVDIAKAIVKEHDAPFIKDTSIIDKYLQPVYNRIDKLDPRSAFKLRDMERKISTESAHRIKEVAPFLTKLTGIKNPIEKKALELQLMNGKRGAAEALMLKTARGAEMAEDARKLAAVMDNVGDELVSTGIITNKLDNYVPRVVKDIDGLLDSLGTKKATQIQNALDQAAKHGKELSANQEADIINKLMAQPPRGSGKPGYSKSRVIREVPEKLQQYYEPLEVSVAHYLERATAQINKARLLGKHFKKADGEDMEDALKNSVGRMIANRKDTLSRLEEKELSSLIHTRMFQAEQSPHKILQGMKNLTYAMLLGNPVAATTQLSDVAATAYVNGLKPTLRAIVSPNKSSLDDFGLADKVAQEFTSTGWTSKVLNTTLKFGLFKGVDKFGKNVLLNSTLNRATAQSKSAKGIAVLARKHQRSFGTDEFNKLVRDLKAGDKTDRVDALLFNELSDIQPISLLEMPEAYLQNPNGRVMYMLKTFTIKQLQLVRRDAIHDINNGKVAKGMAAFTKYGLILGSANAGTGYIKDWMRGKEVEPELWDVPLNLLKTLGWSSYQTKQAFKGKPVQTFIELAMPPFAAFDKFVSGDSSKATGMVPLIGRLIEHRDLKKTGRKIKRAVKGAIGAAVASTYVATAEPVNTIIPESAPIEYESSGPTSAIDHLRDREGYDTKVYEDSEGKLTAGLGHLLTDAEKSRYGEGEEVPQSQLDKWEKADIKKATNAARAQMKKLPTNSVALKEALLSVNFQLGPRWYLQHYKTWKLMQQGKWNEAADEVANSLWNEQTPVRVKDLQKILRSMHNE